MAEDAPHSCARQHIFLVPFGQKMCSHPPRQRRPTDQSQNERDEEEPHLGGPFLRDEGGNRHEERDRRNRSHSIGHHLQHGIDPAAVIARHPANDQRQHKGDEHPDRANLQRCPDGVKRTREDVLAGPSVPNRWMKPLSIPNR